MTYPLETDPVSDGIVLLPSFLHFLENLEYFPIDFGFLHFSAGHSCLYLFEFSIFARHCFDELLEHFRLVYFHILPQYAAHHNCDVFALGYYFHFLRT